MLTWLLIEALTMDTSCFRGLLIKEMLEKIGFPDRVAILTIDTAQVSSASLCFRAIADILLGEAGARDNLGHRP